jgi:hypothetical protein
MGFHRANVSADGKLLQPMRAGDGFTANPIIKNFAAETDETLTTAELSGGSIQQGTTLTSDVVYTLPTAALVAAEFPTMDITDTYVFEVTNAQAAAFDVVIAVGAGMTAIGANNSLSVPPQSSRLFKLVKTAAATFDLF